MRRSSEGLSVLGLGTGQLGGDSLTDGEALALMARAFEAGVTVFDSAPSYGRAEERLGRFLASVPRDAVVVSTKGGYGVPNVPEWTAACIEQGIEQALRRLKLERLDLFHLHSCPVSVLEHHGVLEALERARAAGKVRWVAYSGENEALAWAAPRCDVVQCSVNVADQRSLSTVVAQVAGRGGRVLAKRPLANAVWRHQEQPVGVSGEVYWQRVRTMGLDFGARWPEVALRFSAFSPGVTTALVGTSSVENLQACVRAVELGPLPEVEYSAITQAFARCGQGWRGEI